MNMFRRALPIVFGLVLTPALAAAAPMRVALLVDNSVATAAAIVQVRAGLAAFLDALAPEHEVIVVSTGRRPQVRLGPSLDRAKLKANVGGLLSENGPTSLINALTDVDERFMRKAKGSWPVFVIVTGDGSENSQNVDEQGFNRWATELAGRGILVNAVVLKTTGNGLPGVIASTLTKATDGHYAVMSNGSTLAETLTQLAGQINQQAAQR
jgi:hypothetical protein